MTPEAIMPTITAKKSKFPAAKKKVFLDTFFIKAVLEPLTAHMMMTHIW